MTKLKQLYEISLPVASYLEVNYYRTLLGNSNTLKSRLSTIQVYIDTCDSLEDVRACRRAITTLLSPFGHSSRKHLINMREVLKKRAFEISFQSIVNRIKSAA